MPTPHRADANPEDATHMMDFSTNYLGLDLKTPLTVGASPFADDLDKLREAEEAGAGAITMYSLFEEQITQNLVGKEAHIDSYENSFAEALSYFPDETLLERDVETYLEQLRKVKAAVSIPVVASLNGTREGDWVSYASLMERAGADAIELNLYFLPTDVEESAPVLEDRCVRIVRSVRDQLSVPLAVKLSPFFTALPHFARRLSEAGADGLVLFNRFYQPDIDTDELEVLPSLNLSHSHELLLRLRWLALLRNRVTAQLAVSGGVHTGIDAIKALMAGADCIQMVSSLLINGPVQLRYTLEEMERWLEENEYASLDILRGSMSYDRASNPDALERANYMRILNSWKVSP